MTVVTTPHTYIDGQLTVERLGNQHGGRFKLEGNWALGKGDGTDHFQLIYEALEIAANSDDKFKLVFAAFLDEFMAITYDWDE